MMQRPVFFSSQPTPFLVLFQENKKSCAETKFQHSPFYFAGFYNLLVFLFTAERFTITISKQHTAEPIYREAEGSISFRFLYHKPLQAGATFFSKPSVQTHIQRKW